MADIATLTLSETTQANGNSHTEGTIHATGDCQTNGDLQEAFVDRVAISANTPELVPDLVDQIASLGKVASLQDNTDRTTLLEAARSLVYALETPREAMIRYCWSQSTLYASLETGVDLGLFAILSKDDKPKSAAELAKATGADPVLLARILKHLCAMGVILETGPNEYRRTGVSISLSLQRYNDAYPCMTNCITAGVLALPAQLKKDGYTNPSNGKDCAFQRGFRTDLHFFDFMKENLDAASQFNNHMSAYHQGRPSWMDVGFFDVPSLFPDVTQDDVLLVDVGGSLGHDISEFKRKWPDAPGRLVIEDLPDVVAQAKSGQLDPSIETLEHDFFNEQPIKGARAYYMHSVLHDWSDDNCRKILKGLVNAMKRGHSKVLINENVIPDTNAYWETTSLDIIMMADFASTERTEAHWHQLVGSAGLKITKIWSTQKGVESLIECELA
ncbi:O-methyltransferase family 2 [Penicillium psychrosexuale]|uniref:O-methyltransferase family 2 n=1 Tax=Penicillium psychrosexuale TaxID=1002107 RepID=UPI002545961F|nr:O-methyltransferase family 2 [Penicillium psychrosexuale]KAJ5789596.1 O-methyltransferase family 2 [Penicillium psychrosexuale]